MDAATAPQRLVTFTATIAISTQLSDAIDLGASSLNAIQMPAAFTGTTMTFEGSFDGTTYAAVYDGAGVQVTATVAASRFIVLTPGDFSGVRYLKIKSGSSETAARSVTLLARVLS